MNLNAYRIMWLFVFFDLPVKTKRERKAHVRFVINLKKDGFTMMQYSIYSRHCASIENGEVHMTRIGRVVPAEGEDRLLMMTDKQFSRIKVYAGKKRQPTPAMPAQLEFF